MSAVPDFIQAARTARNKLAGVTFTEDWFDETMCVVLGRLAQTTSDLDGLIVEVGSWEGKSTIALANAMDPQPVHSVDTWKGSPGEISWELVKERDVYATFLTNIKNATRGNVVVNKMGWRRFFHEHQDPVKFCFIDAEHSYKEVRENIELVLPRLVPGGVLCGDDIHHRPILRAVIDVFGDVPVTGTMWVYTAPKEV